MPLRPPALVRGVAIVLGALLLVACGGGGDAKLDAAEQRYADAFAKQLANKEDGFGVDAKGGACIGTAIMRELGTAPFTKAKVQPKDLTGGKSPGELLGKGTVTGAQAKVIAAKWQGCVDLPKAFATQASGGFGLTTKAETCFEGKLRKSDVLDRYVRVSFTSDDPDDAQPVLTDILALVKACQSSGDQATAIVQTITQTLTASGKVTAAQATCMAQKLVDAMGVDRLVEITGTAGSFAEASPELQKEFQDAIDAAGTACGVPASVING